MADERTDGRPIAIHRSQPAERPAMASIQEALRIALDHHRAGRLREAEALYRRILDSEPGHAEALHLAGVAAAQSGRPDDAVGLIRAAIARDAREPRYHANLASALALLERWTEAAAALGAAAALEPEVADHRRSAAAMLERALTSGKTAVLEKANALADAGRPGEAVNWYARSLAIQPAELAVLHDQALVLREVGRLAEAFDRFRRAARIDPSCLPALGNLVDACLRLGKQPEAKRVLATVLVLDPSSVPAVQTLGQCGDARAVRRMARLAPFEPAALADFGAILYSGGGGREAARAYRDALALTPADAAAWTSLGAAENEDGRTDEAIRHHERAGRLDPRGVGGQAWTNLAVALLGAGRRTEAERAFRQALALRPNDPVAHSNLLFCLCFSPDAEPRDVFCEHLRFGERFPALPRPEPQIRDPERPLRIGYVSPDMRRLPGPTFLYLLPVFEGHDHRRFTIIAYHNHARSDAATERFRAAAALWRECRFMDDSALSETIKADGIDILIEATGHMAGNRLPLFALRPAPLQVGLSFYPNTTGLPAIDYRIVDPVFAPPEADELHSEALIRLPDCHLCYRPAPSPFAPPRCPPSVAAGCITFGCFNNPAKLNAATVAVWARILRESPGSRLMLKWRDLCGPTGERLASAFVAEGVERNRIVLRNPTADLYDAYREIDVGLDPLFANGGTTTCDALWMGVPVVSLIGRAFFARVGLLHLGHAGLSGLVAEDVETYVARAVRLARDPSYLAEARTGLRERFAGSPAMDEKRYVANLEEAYRIIWRRLCRGEPPSPLDLRMDPASSR